MGIKIMMPPDVVDSVAGALIAKRVLREIVNTSVKTSADEHYFVVMMHKGVSGDLHHLSFVELAKLLSCETSKIHGLIAEHMINGSARGGCKVCNAASRKLKMTIVEEKTKDHGADDPFSLWILMSASTSSKARATRYSQNR